ncbi:MAG: hypothetical protein KDA85_14900, partial [Planctomycetaceae bacterium]|nr:hypothetical protein [Planctomycetaceae bacterium]
VFLISNVSGLTEVSERIGNDPIMALAANADFTRIAAADSSKHVTVWSLKHGKRRPTVEKEVAIPCSDDDGRPWRMVFSPDNQRLAIGLADGVVRIVDPATGNEVSRIQAHGSYVKELQFEAGHRRLITAGLVGSGSSRKSELKVWDTTTGKLIRQVYSVDGTWKAGFARHGRWIASGSEDGRLKIWDFETGREVFSLDKAHVKLGDDGKLQGAEIHDIAFSPDGTLLGTAGFDKVGKIWTIDDSDPEHLVVKQAIELPEHFAEVTGIAFSHNGLRAVTSGKDGYVRVWLLDELMPQHFEQHPVVDPLAAPLPVIEPIEAEVSITPEPSNNDTGDHSITPNTVPATATTRYQTQPNAVAVATAIVVLCSLCVLVVLAATSKSRRHE